MNNHIDFSQAVTDNNERFADLSNRAMSVEVNEQNHSQLTGALIMIALGGFITRRLAGIQDSLTNATATADSTEAGEAAAAKLILSSNEEVGQQWRALSTEFLNAGEGLLSGIVLEANVDGLPMFVRPFVDSAQVASRMTFDMNDPKAFDKFKAMQYAKIGTFIYGILVEDKSALGNIRHDADIGKVYDRFDQMTLDETFQIAPEVVFPVLFYIANKAEALVEKAKALVPMSDSL